MREHLIRDLAHYQQGQRWLCQRDATLQQVIAEWGSPPLWQRRPGFSSLLHIILEQQVSLASAQAVMHKLRALVPRLTPAQLLTLSDRQLSSAGFSRQKARYARLLAQALQDGSLSLKKLPQLSTGEAREALLGITGIGPWTADIYLMMVLRHRDIWPRGDLALRLAMRELYADELGTEATALLPTAMEDEAQSHFAERWLPWRSVAVRICWLHYLRVRNR